MQQVEEIETVAETTMNSGATMLMQQQPKKNCRISCHIRLDAICLNILQVWVTSAVTTIINKPWMYLGSMSIHPLIHGVERKQSISSGLACGHVESL